MALTKSHFFVGFFSGSRQIYLEYASAAKAEPGLNCKYANGDNALLDFLYDMNERLL